MNARRFLLAGVVQLWLLLASTSSLAIPLISVQPAASNPNVGDSFALSIMISDAADVYAFQFDLSFSAGVIAATGITEGAFLASAGPTFFLAGIIDNTTGSITFTAGSLLGAVAGANGTGSLADLTFDALVAGMASITLQNVILLNAALGDIPFALRNASIVVGSTGVPEPPTSALILLAAILGGWQRVAVRLPPRTVRH